ncbi:Cobyric acid synthase [Fundidesulfovibrio magnetotacticus]|uniref:Cobyric acid synthase n=1 Tax=Fundidesulfovibrio magnetotacticus TaxID=2730080 RepID=A0A6V8LS67_9BACT|nr:cobyric acid synthase [Fundidesulfovibrio magnetotacticus]GFK92949.1 Cobyric acid synthase [Fundidesulfovibrio magnetotacticus]
MSLPSHGGDVDALAREAGCAPGDILDFSASINPLGPPEWLRPVLSGAVSRLAHYPDPHCRELRARARERHGVDEARVVAGNGTSELLFALARACGLSNALVPEPSYVDYRRACLAAGMDVEGLPLRHEDALALDPGALRARLAASGARRAVFIARPNNPTGLDVPAQDVRGLAREFPEHLFVVDEAFGSFVEGFESLAGEATGNVAVLLSLTKMFAVPGLRLGLAVMDEALAGKLRAGLAPWNVNVLAQAVGERALADQDFEERSRKAAASLREPLARELAGLPGVSVWPGRANYLLCRLERPEVPALRAALLKRRIAVRDCSNFAGLDARFFRVAVRPQADNERLLDALADHLDPARPRPARRRPTPALMVQGTTSNAGKSVLAAALCRILRRRGVRVAPFKAQNMSLNSFVTARGEEMGRAQALQAQACGLAPEARMNPVLLKPCSDTGSQVIVLGRPVGTMRVREYVAYKPTAFRAAKEAYDSLAADFDAVILEGAGSPAEVNLKAHDMVNMAMAKYARSRVLLAGDIDRGGVFAALAGTMELLPEDERALVGGYVLNRFRGDPSLLEPAHRYMLDLTGKPVLGVVPEIAALGLPEEDSVSFKAGIFWSGSLGAVGRELDIAVIDLPHISNFTDFDALSREPDAGLRVVRRVADLGRPDAVILPGSKNTLADLADLRARGLADALAALAAEGAEIVGVCAGLQMLGRELSDPTGLESGLGRAPGLGLLDLATELLPGKTLRQARALHAASGQMMEGYEIHHGVTRAGSGAGLLAAREADGQAVAWGEPGRVWGTYLHGLFDAPGFRGWWLDALRARKGLPPLERAALHEAEGSVEAALDRLADTVEAALDMEAVTALMGLR